MDLKSFRQQYPQYDDLSDQQLADSLHSKFYSDMPRADFDAKIGLGKSGPGAEGGASVFDQALQQFPILQGLGLSVQQSPGRSDAPGSSPGQAVLEFWRPGEPGSPETPRPEGLPLDAPGVEIYSDKTRPIDVLGDVVSHHLVDTDPRVAGYYKQFRDSLTDWQRNRLRSQYETSQKQFGEERPFEQWLESSGLPAYFRGYAFDQWGDGAKRMYTPGQIAMFDEMMGYLQQPREPVTAAPVTAAPVTGAPGEGVTMALPARPAGVTAPPSLAGAGVTGGLPQAGERRSPGESDDLGIPEVSMGQGAFRGFSRQLLDNLLASPEVASALAYRLLAPREIGFTGAPGTGFGPVDLIAGGMKALTGGAVDPTAAAGRVRGRLDAGVPFIDMPSAAEASAATDTALQLPAALLRGQALQPAARYDQALERQQVTDIRGRESAPVSTAVGEVGGDIATILALRAGGRGVLTGSVAPAAPAAATATAQPVGSVIGNTLKSFARAAGRAGGSAARAGSETALLAALHDADPLQAAGLAAGGDVIGQISKGAYRNLTASPARLLGTIAVAASGALAIEQWTPGGLDRVLPSLEDANKHVWLSVVLSGLTSLPARQPGAALRGSGLPFERALGDLLGAVPRAAMESTIVWAVNNPADAGPFLRKFAEDPDYFGPKAQRLWTRAMTTEGADPEATFKSLMDDRDFRRKIAALKAQ